MLLPWAALYLYSVLIGSVPTPYIIARLVKGVDLREYGSGNIGTANLRQLLGAHWTAPLVLFEFFLKGVSPVVVATFLFSSPFSIATLPWPALAAPLLALTGNNWSAFIGFRGGRGLVVICGILAAMTPLLFLAGLSLYLAGWSATRSSGPWALAALASLCFLPWLPGGWLTTDLPALSALATDGNRQTTLPAIAPIVLSCFNGIILTLVILKRLTGNSLAFPAGTPRRQVLLNRLLKDRDVADRAEWLARIPDQR